MTYDQWAQEIIEHWAPGASPQEIIDGGREQLVQNIHDLCNDQSFMQDSGYSDDYVGPAAQRDIVQSIWDEAIKRTEDHTPDPRDEPIGHEFHRELHEYRVQKGEIEE